MKALLLAVLLAGPLGAGFFSADAAAAPARKDLAPASGKLRISGSGTMAPMVVEFAKRFKALYPGAQIEVEANGSGRGMADVRQGKADIGMVSHALTRNEGDLYGFAI